MTLKEACKSALTILKQVMEEKLNATNVEVGKLLSSHLLVFFSRRGPIFITMIGSDWCILILAEA